MKAMQELRRVLVNGKYAVIFIALILLNMIVLYREQANENYCNDIFAYGQTYQKIISQIESIDFNEIQYQLEEKQKNCKAIISAMDAFLARYETLEGFDDTYPDLARGFDKIDYEYISYEQQIVVQLLKQVQELINYPEYLSQIQDRKDRMMKFSFLQSESGFALRNVEKTAQDFQSLEEIDIQFGSDQAITAFVQYRLPDYLSLIIIMIFCLKFSEDQRKGLWELFHSLPRGRRWLAANRIFILFTLSFAIMALLYISTLVECFALFGGVQDLGRPIQSISIFQTCTLHISIFQYLIYFFAFRLCATFLLALVMWNLLRCFKEIKYSILLIAVILGVEYYLYNSIPEQSYLNILKYINLFSFIHINPVFTGYFNLNLFGYPLNARPVIIILLLPCIILALLICFCERRITGNKLILRLRWKTSIKAHMISRLHFFGFELYKLLIIQKGLPVFAVLLIILLKFQFFSYIPRTDVERQTETYLTQLEGEITQNTISEITRLQEEIDTQKDSFSQAETAYLEGQISYAEYYKQASQFDSALLQEAALYEVQSRVSELQIRQQASSEKLWILSENNYKSMYGFIINQEQDEESFTKQHTLGVLSLAALCLLIAGSYSYENQSGINNLLNTMAKGKSHLRMNKLKVNLLITFFVWLCINGIEVYRLYQETSLSNIHAPVQSLSIFPRFPLHISIMEFLLIVYLIRLINLWCVTCFIMLLSKWCKREAQATLISIIIFVIPSLIYAIFGTDTFQYLALSIPVSVMGTLVTDTGTMQNCIVMTLIMLFCAIFSLLLIKYYKKEA